MEFITAYDCSQMLRIAPPALDDAVAVRPGHYVQVCLSDELGRPSERFWVRVSEVRGTSITGTVANHLATDFLEYGDNIAFEVGHVIAVMNHIKREYRLNAGVTDVDVCQELGQRLLHFWQCQERGERIDGDAVTDMVTDIFLAFGRFEEQSHETT